MSSAFNFTTGRTIYTFPQLQNDISASNFSVNCDPRSVGPIESSINSSSRAGKLAVETDICDLTISGDLTVNGLIFAKFSATDLTGGTNYSDYLYFDDTTDCFAVGSEEVHIGANATTVANTKAIAIGASAKVSGTNSSSAVAIGVDAEATAGSAIAIGDTANVSAAQAIAIGKSAKVSGTSGNSIAIGANTKITDDNSIVIGEQTATDQKSCLYLNSSGAVVDDNPTGGVGPADNVLKIVTVPLQPPGTGVSGLKKVSTSSITIPQIPGGTDSRFTHYLVYDPNSGEIQICPF